MNIIFNTVFGIFLFIAAIVAIVAFVFKDQFRRLGRYLRSWWAEDTRKEERERRIREAQRKAEEEEELREVMAREKAEAEIEELNRPHSEHQ